MPPVCLLDQSEAFQFLSTQNSHPVTCKSGLFYRVVTNVCLPLKICVLNADLDG